MRLLEERGLLLARVMLRRRGMPRKLRISLESFSPRARCAPVLFWSLSLLDRGVIDAGQGARVD